MLAKQTGWLPYAAACLHQPLSSYRQWAIIRPFLIIHHQMQLDGGLMFWGLLSLIGKMSISEPLRYARPVWERVSHEAGHLSKSTSTYFCRSFFFFPHSWVLEPLEVTWSKANFTKRSVTSMCLKKLQWTTSQKTFESTLKEMWSNLLRLAVDGTGCK